jgi:hypothetical protein
MNGPIPAKYLAPYGIAFTPPVITEQPTNTTAVEGQFALFQRQKSSNGDLMTYRWQQDGADVPGGTGSILNFGR